MDDLVLAVDALKLFSEEKGPDEQLIDGLKSIISKLKADDSKQMVAEELMKNGIVDAAISIIAKSDILTPTATARLSEMIAELTKVDQARKSCTDLLIISPLVGLISHNVEEVVIQSCRALGNICYDNDTARGYVKDLCGVEKLVQLLQKLLTYSQMPDNLRTVVSGCLFNMTDTYEDTQDQALKAGIIEVLLQYLHRFYGNEEIATHCLLVLNCLADLECGRNGLMEKSALASLLSLFEMDFHEESLESLLELFGNLAENDTVKFHLATHGFTERLLKLIRQHQKKSRDEESTNTLKTMYELVILILTGDESMEHLYSKGTGLVYKETLGWLCSPEESVEVTGALAIGNFARNDTHCIQIVADNVTEDLLAILKKHSGVDGDIRLQHAVLSALRNLAIPVQNKSLLIKAGVVDYILPMIVIETFPVVFKLLGTFRMLIDKQDETAVLLGTNNALIKRLVTWSQTDDHPGVKGEATRLLAWLMKNAKSSEVAEVMVKEGVVLHLVAMLSSEHLLMQSEALLALTIMACANLVCVEPEFQKANLCGALKKRLKDESVPEILQNAITMITTLARSNLMKSLMVSSGIDEDLKSLCANQNDKVKSQASTAFNLLQNDS